MKKSQLIIVIFIVVIMVSSVIGFVNVKQDNNLNQNSIDYSGVKFNIDNNGRYQANINDKSFIFDYLPDEIKDINLPEFNVQGEKYYLIINYSEKDNNIDYSLNKLGYTLNLLGIRAIIACDNEENCNLDLPVKDCSNNAFYIKKSNVNKVYLQDKCITIEGDNLGISKIIDKINLKLAGIK